MIKREKLYREVIRLPEDPMKKRINDVSITKPFIKTVRVDQKRGKTGKNQGLESFHQLAMILFRGEHNERKQYKYRSHRSSAPLTKKKKRTYLNNETVLKKKVLNHFNDLR